MSTQRAACGCIFDHIRTDQGMKTILMEACPAHKEQVAEPVPEEEEDEE